ncbi:MAG: hypothetical protein UR61_C0041G0006 [candidate division WS6 bacterium GW2011_GWE1_34_7]|uniref:DUF5659 domain-containing protein n=1 Tax=candidate division WS6 bacterium GW2011_GWE1_34_7 TaxID=1619093 RepID=A0A0G0B5V0_9BACT|nr:MAG: hypothetical protein UR61_C0041G0006 [candidate division WS6 bacterium GW2011_GWE1_34_7]
MQKQINNIFTTDNFVLAAYLLTESCLLVHCDKTNPRRVIFHFENSNEREILTQKFLGYEARIEPNKFFSAQKNLKQLIYSS